MPLRIGQRLAATIFRRPTIEPEQTDMYSLADAAYATVLSNRCHCRNHPLYWKDLVQMALACCGKSTRGSGAKLMIAPQQLFWDFCRQTHRILPGQEPKCHLRSPHIGCVGYVMGAKAKIEQRQSQKSEQLNDRVSHLKKAFYIGCLQCLAMWPGTSLSDDNHHRRLFVGLQPAAAKANSVFSGIHNLIGCIWLQDNDRWSFLSGLELGPLIVDSIAFVTYCLVKWFVAYIGRHGMALFAYRILLACAILLYFN